MSSAAEIPQPLTSLSPTTGARAGALTDRIAFPATVAILLGIFLLVHNPYWVPGGDSDVYTAIARNLALGKGYRFNGQPVGMVPPGWPMVMAGVMKVAPYFSVLKFVTLFCMLGSLAISYWICRRFASPAITALVILLSGLLSHIYSLTFWLHSDALFCLISSAAILIAFQWRESGQTLWRAIVLVLLCCVAVFVRWAGLLTWLLVAAVLIEDELKPSRNARWTLALVTGLIAALTFFGIRRALTVPKDVQVAASDFGGATEEAPTAVVEKADNAVATTYDLFNPSKGGFKGLIARGLRWGNWISYLLWQPMRLGGNNPAIGVFALLIGWIVLSPLLLLGYRSILQRQWLWPALLLYSLALVSNWPAPNARYLVPVAPLIILGIFNGMDLAQQRINHPKFARFSKVLLGYFVVSMIVCNGALWGVDVYVARSKNFYGAYEAGLEQDLISAGQWLTQKGAGDVEIGICWRYSNLGRLRYSPTGLRALNLLTDRAIVRVPDKYTRGGDPHTNPNMLAWAHGLNIKYVLYQTEVTPWRLFHFRVGWLQEWMTGEPAQDSGAGWRLYEVSPAGDVAKRVSLNWPDDVPTRVPGM